MRTIVCPRCGSPIQINVPFRPTAKPFCARCGWNLQRAEAALESVSTPAKFIPLGAAVVCVFVGFSLAQTSSRASLLIPLLIGSIMLVLFWSNYSSGKAIAAAKLSANPSLAQSQPFIDPSVQQLQALPRPRRVHFRVPRAVIAVLGAAILFSIVAVYVASHAGPDTRSHIHLSGIFIVPVIFIVLVAVPFFRDQRNGRLIRDGEFALGRVTFQERVQAGKSSYSRIGYEFKTGSSQLIRSQVKDLTYSVFEDMTIPVFYDPLDPSKNITPCATYLQLSTD